MFFRLTMTGQTSNIIDVHLTGLDYILFGCSPNDYVNKNSYHHAFVIAGNVNLFASFLLSIIDVLLMKTNSIIDIILGLYTGIQTVLFALQWILIIINLPLIVNMNLNLMKYKSFQIGQIEATDMLNRRLKQLNKGKLIYKIVCNTTVLGYAVIPVLEGLLPLLSNKEMKPIFVFPIEFPFNPVYSIFVFVPQAFVLLCAALISVGFFDWAATTALLICTQISIMGEVLQNDQSDMPLRDFVQDMQSLLECTNILFKILQTVVSCKIGVSAFTLTLAAFTMASKKMSLYDLLKLLLDNAFYFLEIYVFCHIGSIITHAWLQIGNHVYFSAWYLRDKNYRKDVINVIHQTQKEVVPKAWFGLVKIQLPTIIDILQLCYSYYNLLIVIQK